MIEHLPECPKSGCPACHEQGQRDALSAARKAVAALATQRELRSPSGVEIDINQALAAIDALIEAR